MDPTVVEAVKTVLLEATKILGPAIVAALVTYKATRAHLELKIRELEQTHAYGAREHWFKYYKDRQDQLAKDHERLNEGLGRILGMASGYVEGNQETQSHLVSTLAETVLTFSKLTASEIEATACDMEENGLSDSPDRKKLISYLEPLCHIDQSATFESLKRNLFLILEVHQFLQRCNDTLLRQQMRRTFSRYVDA